MNETASTPPAPGLTPEQQKWEAEKEKIRLAAEKRQLVFQKTKTECVGLSLKQMAKKHWLQRQGRALTPQETSHRQVRLATLVNLMLEKHLLDGSREADAAILLKLVKSPTHLGRRGFWSLEGEPPFDRLWGNMLEVLTQKPEWAENFDKWGICDNIRIRTPEQMRLYSALLPYHNPHSPKSKEEQFKGFMNGLKFLKKANKFHSISEAWYLALFDRLASYPLSLTKEFLQDKWHVAGIADFANDTYEHMAEREEPLYASVFGGDLHKKHGDKASAYFYCHTWFSKIARYFTDNSSQAGMELLKEYIRVEQAKDGAGRNLKNLLPDFLRYDLDAVIPLLIPDIIHPEANCYLQSHAPISQQKLGEIAHATGLSEAEVARKMGKMITEYSLHDKPGALRWLESLIEKNSGYFSNPPIKEAVGVLVQCRKDIVEKESHKLRQGLQANAEPPKRILKL